jgi:hypothetical protein
MAFDPTDPKHLKFKWTIRRYPKAGDPDPNETRNSFTELGKALNPSVCKECTIYLFACNVGPDAVKELAKESGCSVYSYRGDWKGGEGTGTWIPNTPKDPDAKEFKTGPDGETKETGGEGRTPDSRSK